MVAADLGQQRGSGQPEKLSRLAAIAPGVAKHSRNLPALDRLERLRRWGSLTQCLTQPLKIELRQVQIQHQQSRTFTRCPYGGRGESRRR